MSSRVPDVVRMCIDRVPPPETPGQRMALVSENKWPKSGQIVAKFLDGDATLQERVKRHALVWMRYANLNLYFRDEPTADIRISFKQKGSWSVIGTACRAVPNAEATMNLGWLDSATPEDELHRVVLHEFGHALACIHEHNHPESAIKWNVPEVHKYFSGEPNFWTPEQIDTNVLQHYSKDRTSYSKVDRTSIMIYPIDRALTTDGYEVVWSRELSATDMQFIEEMYP
jgi:hypothetical protein